MCQECDNHDPNHSGKHGHDHGHDHYACPMHPEVTEHTAGQCPKCGMNLTQSEHKENDAIE